MRVAVVGGSGEMGSAASYDLMKSEGVEQVVLLSRRAKKENLHPKLAASEKVSVKNVDVNDTEQLVKYLKDFDAVVNCVGPFFSTGYKVVKAAIQAGVHYVDIDDDYDSVKLMLDPELDRQAKEAGITVLYSMGADPGTGNILARKACDEMDQVDIVDFYWVLGAYDCTGKAVWEHVLHMNTCMVPQFIDGRLQDVPAGSEVEVVDFIEPFGACEVHFVGHPEPLTFPKYFLDKGVKRVTNKGGMLPKWVNDDIRVQNNWGFTGTEPIEVNGQMVSPHDMALELWRERPPQGDLGQYTSGVKVIIKGVKDGNAITTTYDIAGNTAPGTGIPPSIGAQMIVRGDITERGVLPPEACVDPQIYLDEFVKRKAVIYENRHVENIIKK